MVLLIQSGTLRSEVVSDAVRITFQRRKTLDLPQALAQPPADWKRTLSALEDVNGGFALCTRGTNANTHATIGMKKIFKVIIVFRHVIARRDVPDDDSMIKMQSWCTQRARRAGASKRFEVVEQSVRREDSSSRWALSNGQVRVPVEISVNDLTPGRQRESRDSVRSRIL